jgi:hypothetical protein
MDDVAVMHELYRMADLPHHPPHLLLAETALLPQRSVDVPPAAGLQNEVKMIFIMKESIELDDVGVIEVALDFDLPHQLVDEPGFPLEYLFGDLLQGADKFCLFMPTSIYAYTAK